MNNDENSTRTGTKTIQIENTIPERVQVPDQEQKPREFWIPYNVVNYEVPTRKEHLLKGFNYNHTVDYESYEAVLKERDEWKNKFWYEQNVVALEALNLRAERDHLQKNVDQLEDGFLQLKSERDELQKNLDGWKSQSLLFNSEVIKFKAKLEQVRKENWPQAAKWFNEEMKQLKAKLVIAMEGLESIAALKTKEPFNIDTIMKLDRDSLINLVDTDTAVARETLEEIGEVK